MFLLTPGNPKPVFGQMPDFYSEAETTAYEVIFGDAFQAESHWPSGEAPPWVPGAPPSPKPIKVHVPASAATSHLHQPTRLEAGEVYRGKATAPWGRGGLKDEGPPWEGAGLQISPWTFSKKVTKAAKLEVWKAETSGVDYLGGKSGDSHEVGSTYESWSRPLRVSPTAILKCPGNRIGR